MQAPHAVQVEVISAERVEVLAHQRRCQAENVVIAVLALSTQLINDCFEVEDVLGHHRIVQHREATEGVHLVAEFPSA